MVSLKKKHIYRFIMIQLAFCCDICIVEFVMFNAHRYILIVSTTYKNTKLACKTPLCSTKLNLEV